MDCITTCGSNVFNFAVKQVSRKKGGRGGAINWIATPSRRLATYPDFMGLLDNKLGIVFGVANKRSIAWAIAQAWAREGAKLAFTYQGERLKDNVEELAGTFGADTLLIPCDVSKDEIGRAHV